MAIADLRIPQPVTLLCLSISLLAKALNITDLVTSKKRHDDAMGEYSDMVRYVQFQLKADGEWQFTEEYMNKPTNHDNVFFMLDMTLQMAEEKQAHIMTFQAERGDELEWSDTVEEYNALLADYDSAIALFEYYAKGILERKS